MLRKKLYENNEEMDEDYKPDFYTTTAQAEHTWQPIDDSHLDSRFRKKKNEFSIFVDASFKRGVFAMPLIDPPRTAEDNASITDVRKNFIC
mmetsp:Transcript_4811/g.4554  ORF Transcript_4811/g.4554 Transcript_4811/m.4554 type:complete len:91 (+) Transcript_4811:685-957(+)